MASGNGPTLNSTTGTLHPVLMRAALGTDTLPVLMKVQDLVSKFVMSDTKEWRIESPDSYERLLFHQTAAFYTVVSAPLFRGSTEIIFAKPEGFSRDMALTRADELVRLLELAAKGLAGAPSVGAEKAPRNTRSNDQNVVALQRALGIGGTRARKNSHGQSNSAGPLMGGVAPHASLSSGMAAAAARGAAWAGGSGGGPMGYPGGPGGGGDLLGGVTPEDLQMAMMLRQMQGPYSAPPGGYVGVGAGGGGYGQAAANPGIYQGNAAAAATLGQANLLSMGLARNGAWPHLAGSDPQAALQAAAAAAAMGGYGALAPPYYQGGQGLDPSFMGLQPNAGLFNQNLFRG